MTPTELAVLNLVVERYLDDASIGGVSGRRIRSEMSALHAQQLPAAVQNLVTQHLYKTGDDKDDLYRPTLTGVMASSFAATAGPFFDLVLRYFAHIFKNDPDRSSYTAGELQSFARAGTTLPSDTQLVRLLEIAGLHAGMRDENGGQIFALPPDFERVASLQTSQHLLQYRESNQSAVASTPRSADKRADKSAVKRALIMRGGGAKGIAFVGALAELLPRMKFETFVGTSAGAITAALLAAGYSADELEKILKEKRFDEFFDGGVLGLLQMPFRGGWHAADSFREWIQALVSAKVAHRPVRLKDLPHRAVIYATKAGHGAITFDSTGERDDATVPFAVRCSMSIPYLFVPERDENVRVYDGGLLNNFPVEKFANENKEYEFVALYLGTLPDRPAGTSPIFVELLKLWMDQDEAQRIQSPPIAERTLLIDPAPISTTQFELDDDEKEHLILQGRLAALKFLLGRKLLAAGEDKLLAEVERSARRAKDLVLERHMRRKLRSRTRGGVTGIGLALALGCALGWQHRERIISMIRPPIAPSAATSPTASAPADSVARDAEPLPAASSIPPTSVVPMPKDIFVVRDLPGENTASDFDTLRDISIFDLRAWRRVTPDHKAERFSPVNYINYLHVRRKQKLGSLYRAHYSTGGSAIDLRCITHPAKIYRRDVPLEHPNEEEYAVEVDVSKEAIDKEFLIVVEATYWNGFQDDKEGEASTYTDSNVRNLQELGIFVLFPESKPFIRESKFFHPNGGGQRSDLFDPSVTYSSSDGRFIYWSITNRRPSHHYTVHWTW